MRITIMFSCLLAVGMLVSVPVQAQAQVQAGATAATPHPEGGARPVPVGPRVEVLWERDGDRASECEEIGGFGSGYEFPNRYRGNALAMTEDRELTEFKLELEFTGERDLYFSIHRADPGSNLYTRVEGWTDILVTETGVGRTYYSSGVLDPPVTLESGYRYALGVAWWQPATKYGLDSESYPQDFEGGEVLGGVALTLGDVPPIPATVSLPPYGGGAYSMMICFNPRPGACCIDDNGQHECQYLPWGECLALEDPPNVRVEFTAPGITCEEVSCPLPQGACCVAGGEGTECIPDMNEYFCGGLDGVWYGGESCPDACIPKGACCVGEDCYDHQMATQCADLNGVYQGDETTCAGLPLECGVGACCGADTCWHDTRDNCEDSEGLFAGPGTRCDQDPCEPHGACCVDVDVCEDQLTVAECAGAGGYYRGDGSACDNLDVPCLKGACCTVDFGCWSTPLTQSVCGSIGSWQGEGTSCDSLDPHCPGTCCWAGGCLEGQTPDGCDAIGGDFIGYQECLPDPDPCDSPPAVGACCLTDGSCIEVPQDVCGSFGGAYEDDDVLCSTVSCDQPGETGACCLPGGGCVIQTEMACIADQGAFAGVGTTCEVGLCVPGACCLGADVCDDVTATGGVEFKCGDAGGTFLAGVVCDPYSPCDQFACCLDELCVDLSTLSCTAQQGTQLPIGACEQESCAVGACCYESDLCDVMIGYDCTLELDSTFLEGFDACDPYPCDVVACCKPGSLCEELSTAECLADGGTPLDTDTCAPGICVEGACCSGDSECAELVQYECDGLPGTFVAGVTCASDPCAAGACCHNDGDCLETIRGECDALVGTLIVDAVCDPDPCNVFACCKPGDVCEELTPTECVAQGGTPLDAESCEVGMCVAGACCYDGGTCGELVQYECDVLAGTLLAGLTCDPNPCLVPSLISSVPEDGIIDARQPHPIDDLTPQGFSVIQVCFDMPVFDAGAAALDVDDFTVVETPEQVAPVPTLTAVVDLGGNCYEVQLDRPITPGAWTTIIADVYSESGTAIDPAADRTDIGFLPGDVDSSRMSAAVDVTVLVDALNGVLTLPVTSTDIDRSATTNANDIVQLIDLLRGGEMLEEWYFAQLPPQP